MFDWFVRELPSYTANPAVQAIHLFDELLAAVRRKRANRKKIARRRSRECGTEKVRRLRPHC
jgi:hypothetical protein